MNDDVILAELRRLADAVERNTEVLEIGAARGRLTGEERRMLEDLLPAVADLVGDEVFAAVDVLELGLPSGPSCSCNRRPTST